MIDETSDELGNYERIFAANLRRLRDDRGWSQSDLVAELQQKGAGYINQTAVSRIEQGTRPVRLGEAQAIARAFDRTVSAMTTDPDLDQRLELVSLIRVRAKDGWQRVAAAEASIRDASRALAAARKDLETLEGMAGAADDPEVQQEIARVSEMLRALVDVNLEDELRRAPRG